MQTDFDSFKAQSARDLVDVENERDTALTEARFSGLIVKIGAPILAVLLGYEGGRALHFWK